MTQQFLLKLGMLMHKPQQVFSFSTPGVGIYGYKSESNHSSHGWGAEYFQIDIGVYIVL